ncbi:MAG: tetratricopeptide repeat protein [candidate division WOR-3 bacterium]
MIFFFLILVFSGEEEELYKLRKEYILPLSVEPSFVEKGEAYLNLAVIDIKLKDFDRASRELKKASFYGRKKEAIYLEGVINYLKGDIEKAVSNFKKIDEWEYIFFLENLYTLSLGNPIEKEIINKFPDSLGFYFVFYEEDSLKILDWLGKASIPLWQNFLGRGYLCYEGGKYRRALNYFRESYKIKETQLTGVYIIATLFQLSEFDSLISFQERASINTPLTNYLKGEAYYKKGKMEKALEIFLSDSFPFYETHKLFGAGWCMYQLGEYSQSVSLFKKFLDIYKEGELKQYALYRIGRALLKQGKVESIDYFKEIVEKYPSSPLRDDAYLLLGKINFLLNKEDEAIRWFELLLKEYPSSSWLPIAYKYLGEIFLNKEEFGKAYRCYKEILSLKGISLDLLDEAQYKILEIRWRRGEFPTKIHMYKVFVEKYPKSPRTPSLLLKIAEYYEVAKRYDLAIQFNKKVLFDYPGSLEAKEALFNAVRVYEEMGEFPKAIELLENNIEGEPDLKEKIYLKLGENFAKMRDFKKAIEYYKKVSTDSLKPYSLYQIALLYQELGFLEEARIPLRNIIEKFPDSDYIGKTYLLLAKTYFQEGALKTAIEILNKGLKNLGDKETGELLSFKATIYCELNDEEALELYLESANKITDRKSKIEVLEKGRECAIRLNKTDKVELFENLIKDLKSQ